MPVRLRRSLALAAALLAVTLASGLTPPSSGDLQSRIAAGRSAAASLQSQIAADWSSATAR
jgi:hypothetical protein